MHKIVAAVHVITHTEELHYNLLIGLRHENDFIPELKRHLGDDIYDIQDYFITTETERQDTVLISKLDEFIQETY